MCPCCGHAELAGNKAGSWHSALLFCPGLQVEEGIVVRKPGAGEQDHRANAIKLSAFVCQVEACDANAIMPRSRGLPVGAREFFGARFA